MKLRLASPLVGNMRYVYLLVSTSHLDQHYIGLTRDLKKRLKDHNEGRSKHTAKFIPWKLAAYFAFAGEKTAIEIWFGQDFLEASSPAKALNVSRCGRRVCETRIKRDAIDLAGRIADHGRNHTSIRGNPYARCAGVRREIAARVWCATERSTARSPRSTIALRCRRYAGLFARDEKDSRRKLDLCPDSERFTRPALELSLGQEG